VDWFYSLYSCGAAVEGVDARTRTTTNGETLLRSSLVLQEMLTEVENSKKRKLQLEADGIRQLEWRRLVTELLRMGGCPGNS
jgi:hypothetical protein